MIWSKPYFLAIASGAIFALSWPTIGFAPLIFFAFVPLLYYVEKHSHHHLKEVFRTSYLAFLIWNVAAAWWMCQYDFVGGASVILINTACMAGVVTMFAWFKQKKVIGSQKYLGFVALWLSWEWLQLHWDLSWPWLVLGNSFSTFPRVIQWYEFTGVFGGSLWILMINVLMTKILLLILAKQRQRPLVVTTFVTVLLISIPAIYSLVLFNKPEVSTNQINVLIIQPNTNPKADKTNAFATTVRAKTLALVGQNIYSTTQLVIIPETAIIEEISEDRILDNPTISALIGLQEKYPQSSFIVGAVTTNGSESSLKKYNTAISILKNGKIELYRKAKLVPGVEEYPFKQLSIPLLKMLDRKNFNPKFSKGDSQTCISLDGGTKAGIAICYESIYGEYLSQLPKNGAGVIAMITNDGWWDKTNGYKQHLAYSRLRAIETRTPIARAGNTGISCIIDSKGIVLQQSDWDREQTIKSTVTIKPQTTFYVLYGDYILTIANLITLLLTVLLGMKFLLNHKK